MLRTIAFLRAINVGGHVVKMDALRGMFADLGFSGIKTFIASGNVIFDPPAMDAAALERMIETHLKKTLGYEVATFIRTPGELRDVTALAPFGSGAPRAGHTLFVSFLKSQPDAASVERVMALQSDVDRLHIAGRELYWLRQGGHDSTKLSGASFERALRMQATARNITTLRKLSASTDR